MVCGAVQVTLFPSDDGPVWSLSAWVHSSKLTSWELAFPSSEYRPTILHSRIADALGISSGDEVELEIEGKRMRLPVSVNDKINSDLTISWEAGIVKSSTAHETGGCTALLSTGGELSLSDQELFGPSKPAESKGRGILYFDGVSRKEPHVGPAGVGFSVFSMDENGRGGSLLVSGYRYLGMCTSNHADYHAFMEGMEWAMRFNFEKLWIRGDAQLVVHQLSGKYRVKSSNLKKLYHQAKLLLDSAEEDGTTVTLQHVAHDKNLASEVLANFAVDLKTNATACNWKHINLFLNPEKYQALAALEEEERLRLGKVEAEQRAAAKAAEGVTAEEEAVGAASEEKKESEENDSS